jgi:hypothetical protein
VVFGAGCEGLLLRLMQADSSIGTARASKAVRMFMVTPSTLDMDALWNGFSPPKFRL